jgi:proton-dependent oligopeptide transporter, POT family
VGQACLAFFVDNLYGFYCGLALIALGSGGIKPCVSALVGDQFDASRKAQAKTVFAAFYWSINFGSLFASLFIPKILKAEWGGPRLAFGLPGVLMFIATVIFFAGRKLYVDVAPTGPNAHSFTKVMGTVIFGGGFANAEHKHPAEAIAGARAVLRMLLVFLPIIFFWALFDQKASTWVLQAKAMDRTFVFGETRFVFEPSQMQFINPALVMLLIPLTNGVLYPFLKRVGLEPTYLRRMTAGMFVGVISWLFAGWVQQQMDAGQTMHISWQLGPYVFLTLAEVLVSTTGLEFAYSQAPAEMKGTLMSFWSLTIAAANLGVAQLAKVLPFKGAPLFFFWASLALGGAIALGLIARRYVEVDRYRQVNG